METIIERGFNLVLRSGGELAPGEKTPGQGGILEGQNPTTYDKKNPVSSDTPCCCQRVTLGYAGR